MLEGLKRRNIPFTASHNALINSLAEVFIKEANELIMIPNSILSEDEIRWILEIRTPLRLRLTVFTPNVTDYKLRILRAVSHLKNEGIEIPNLEHAISVQESSNSNLFKLLESLENWHHLKTHGRPLSLNKPMKQLANTPPNPNIGYTKRGILAPLGEDSPYAVPSAHSEPISMEGGEELYTKLRESIKTYWTENYLARFLKVPKEVVRDLVKRTGIRHEICGRDVVYFFDRTKGLSTYFAHILKGILYDLEIEYEETPNHTFFLPKFNVTIIFFDGRKEHLPPLVEDYAKTNDLLVVVPEGLRAEIGVIPDDYFQVVSLSRNQIYEAIKRIVRRHRIRASSGSPN